MFLILDSTLSMIVDTLGNKELGKQLGFDPHLEEMDWPKDVKSRDAESLSEILSLV